jgi:polygalacturonase
VSDGTAAFQAHLDARGTVIIPPGTHHCGTLRLHSDTTLVLPRGATLVFGDDRRFAACTGAPGAGYSSIGDIETADFGHALITARDAARVRITGGGTIEGGRAARGGPEAIALLGCRDVRIDGVAIRRAPNYAISLGDCDDVVVHRVRVVDGFADGIDADASRDVTISECDVASDDDAICVKASLLRGGTPIAARTIVIRDCRVRSASNGVKIGTETIGDVDGVAITGVVVDGRPRGGRDEAAARAARVDEGAGIAVLTVDGGAVRNVTIDAIEAREVAAPIFVRRGARLRRGSLGTAPRGEPGELSGVIVRDLTAVTRAGHRTVDGVLVRDLASAVLGVAGAPVGEVVLERVRLVVPGGRRRGVVARAGDRPAAYPRPSLLGASPVVGLHLRHAPHVRACGVVVETFAPDARPVAGPDRFGRSLSVRARSSDRTVSNDPREKSSNR